MFIQLTGPTFRPSTPVAKPSPVSFSLASIFHRPGFSHHCGLPGKNVFSSLWSLNLKLNDSAISSPFLFRSVRRDVTQILLHEALRGCYESWNATTMKEEAADLIRTGRPSIRTSPRFAPFLPLFSQMLLQSQCVDYYGQISRFAPLPAIYIISRSSWKPHSHQIQTHLDDLVTQETNHINILPNYRNAETPSRLPDGDCSDELARSTVPPRAVASFLIECISRIVPKQLIGRHHNWHLLLNQIREFVHGGSSIKPIQSIVKGMRLSEVEWIQPRGKPTIADHLHSERLFQSFIGFLFHDLIVCICTLSHEQLPLISNHFYCSPSSTGVVVFYRKPVFNALVQNAIRCGYYSHLYSIIPSKPNLPQRAVPLQFTVKMKSDGAIKGIRPICNMKGLWENPFGLTIERQTEGWSQRFISFERFPSITRNGCLKPVASSFWTMLQKSFLFYPRFESRLPQHQQMWSSVMTPFVSLWRDETMMYRTFSFRSSRLSSPNRTTNSSPILFSLLGLVFRVHRCVMFLSLLLFCLRFHRLQTQSSAVTRRPLCYRDNKSWKPL